MVQWFNDVNLRLQQFMHGLLWKFVQVDNFHSYSLLTSCVFSLENSAGEPFPNFISLTVGVMLDAFDPLAFICHNYVIVIVRIITNFNNKVNPLKNISFLFKG